MNHLLLNCSPYFVKSALNEVRRFHPDTQFVQSLIPGHLLLQSPCAFSDFVAPWQRRLPIYLHHAFPVQHVLPLDGTRHDLARLKSLLREIAPNVPIQARISREMLPYTVGDIERMAARPHQPLRDRVVSVFIAQVEKCLQAYIGVSLAAQNLSPWAGGLLPMTQPVSNRAGYKLIEALETFAIRLRPQDHVLDLGAAPGAWTTILRQRGVRVTTVAPAPLYPWLALDRHVTHHALTAEDFLSRCRDTFDLIVNDMVLDGQESARLMVAYAAHLRPQGIAIMTLKLREAGRLRVMDHSLRILRQAYKIIRVRQLVYNRKEVTLFLRKK